MSARATDDRIVATLRERVPGLVAVYRFGSSGTAAERVSSDLDLAVLTDRPLSSNEQTRLRWETAEAVAALVGRDVDLVDLGGASSVLRARIVTSGTRMWCNDVTAAERFEDYAMSSYARLNEERAAILRDIHERGRIRG